MEWVPLAPAQADTRPPEPIDLAEHQIRRKQVLGGLTLLSHEHHHIITTVGYFLLATVSLVA
jgi:hypothetical protein